MVVMKRHVQRERWASARARWRVRRRAELMDDMVRAINRRILNTLLWGNENGPPPAVMRRLYGPPLRPNAGQLRGTRSYLPMRTCSGCGMPIAVDVCGNTDHVCLPLRLTATQQRMMDVIDELRREGEPVRVVIESTAQGSVHDWFWDRWRQRNLMRPGAVWPASSGVWSSVFLPWFHLPVFHDDTDPED